MFTQIQKSVLFLCLSICALGFAPVQSADDVTARNARRRLAKLCHQLMPSLKERQNEAELSLQSGYQILDEVRMHIRGFHPGRHLIPLPPGCRFSSNPVSGRTTESYGNKYDNLRILEEAGFNVPAFQGVSSEKICAFIEKNDSSILEDWKTAGEAFAARRTLQDPIIKTLLQNIAIKITALFSSIEPTSLFDATALDWFDSVKEAGNMLMVRSTGGGEDGEKSPLAGCNESPAYISPEPDAVGAAMGVVLVSYFSEQSLKTRIATGANPFDENLLIPVLFHELIGEKVGGKKDPKIVPRSGVMFTDRRDLTDDRATRITTATATFGHGEGAVANRAPCDSYHMTASKARPGTVVIVPHIAHKNVRILPMREESRVVLHSGRNSDELAMSPALSPAIATELFDIGRRIEELYGMPMDVEFVVKNNVVFIVQARPLEKALAQPRCIVIDQEVDTSAFVRGELSLDPITLGNDMLTIISGSSAILTAKTLDEADRDPRSAGCRVAVSEKGATALSHPAINFSSRGVPTFYTKSLSLFEAMMARAQEEGLTLVFDAQNHRVLLWDTSAQAIEPFIRNEWRDHPVEGGTSFYLDRYEQIFGSTYDGDLYDDEEKLLQVIAHGSPKEVRVALQNLKNFAFEQLAIVHKFVSDSGLSFAHEEYIRNLYTEGKLQLQVLFDEIVYHIDRPEHSKLIRLYYVKKLSELLFGSSEEGTHLGSLGIAHYPQLLGCVHLGSELHTVDECAPLALYAKQAPLTPEGRGKWVSFVCDLQQEASSNPEIAEQVAVLSAMLQTYSESGALPAWFYTDFFPTFHKEATMPEKLAELLAGYSETSKAFLVKIEEYSLELSSLQRSVSDCSEPRKIGTFWAKLKRLALAVSGDEYCTRFKSQPASVQNVACSFMHGLVALFDEAIKTMKSSFAFSDRQKVQYMKVYVKDYFTLLKIWGTQIMPVNALNYHPQWDCSTYMADIEMILHFVTSNRSASRLLLPSPTFSVNAAVLGSRTAFNRHYPETLEDCFTLVHQNLLVVLGAIQNQHLLNQDLLVPGVLPVQMQEIIKELERCRSSLRGTLWGLRRIGVVVKPQTYKVTFNIPIRNHSAMVELLYDAKEQKTYMTVRFLGQARGRWREMVHLAHFMGWATGEPLAEGPYLNERSGEISWCLDVTMYQALGECLGMGIQISESIPFNSVLRNRMSLDLIKAALPGLVKASSSQHTQTALSVLEMVIDNQSLATNLQPIVAQLLRNLPSNLDPIVHIKLLAFSTGTTIEAVIGGDIPQDPAFCKRLVNAAKSMPSSSSMKNRILKGLLSSEAGAIQIIAQREGLAADLVSLIRYEKPYEEPFFRVAQVSRETFFECAISDILSSKKELRELGHIILVSLAGNGYEVDRILQVVWEVYKKHPKTGAALIFELAQKGIDDSLWVKLLCIRLGYASVINNHHNGIVPGLAEYARKKYDANMLNKLIFFSLFGPILFVRDVYDRGLVRTVKGLGRELRWTFDYIGYKIQELCRSLRSRL